MTILVSKKDDHLKYHGFLYTGNGQWRLSPALDVNPSPDRNPHLEMAIIEGGVHDRSINLALEASPSFEMAEADARQTIREMAHTIAGAWRDSLREVGVARGQAKGYEPAFVHEESDAALSL